MKKDFFNRGVDIIIEEASFNERLKAGKKLRIKYGVDPTRPDIHLGHAVALRRLKELQDDGHTIIFLIGDYTTKIGDPSGRNTTRPVLADEEIKVNAETYLDQVGKILDLSKTEVRYNSEWLSNLSFNDLLQLAGKFTVAQIIDREDFKNRLNKGIDIGLHETLYPLMQAYDSVALEADVEVGGSDQLFNLLAGRDLQRKVGQRPQEIITFKLLVGLDGKVKMSKSADNYISITDDAATMFGKVMSIPDDQIVPYYQLCTEVGDATIEKLSVELKAGQNPRGIKVKLAKEIVELYHDTEAADKAAEEFDRVFTKGELPADIPEVEIEIGNYDLFLLLANLEAVSSRSEARRLVEQGGVRIDGAKISDPATAIAIHPGMVIQIGKRKIYKIK